MQFRVVDSFFVASNDYLVSNIDNMQDWRLFEKAIAEARNVITDFRLVNDLKDKVEKAFTMPVCTSVINLHEKNAIQLSHIFQKMIQESTGLQRVDVSFEIAKISSLEMEMDSISTRKMDSAAPATEKVSEPEKTADVAAAGDEPKAGANGIKAVLRSSLILAPIKGRHIGELKIGDRVMVSMVEMNDQSKSVARAFNAYNEEEGRILPVPGRIKSLRYIDGTGYKIFVVIAKGILGQIIEEEKNIKVLMDPASEVHDEKENASTGKSGLVIIIALLALILVLVGFIVVMVL